MRWLGLYVIVILLSGAVGCRQQEAGSGDGTSAPLPRFGEDFPVIAPTAPAEAYQPGIMPQRTLQIYMEALTLGTRDLALPLYTAASRELLARVPTPVERQRQELELLKRGIMSIMVEMEMPLAVIRFPVNERLSLPYLFRAGETGWELDLAAMDALIAVDGDGRWRFRRLDHEYMFAFGNLPFDSDGYPGR